MSWRFPKRFVIVTLSLLAALFVGLLSLWRLNLPVQGVDDREYSAKVSVGERIEQLFSLPILPDHPLYVLGMVVDRIDLLLASPSKRFALDLSYADTRMATGQALITRGRYSMAISSLTKSEKYILAAADQIRLLPENEKNDAKQKLSNSIKIHVAILKSMKPYFNDPQQAVIDGLIAQVNALLQKVLG